MQNTCIVLKVLCYIDRQYNLEIISNPKWLETDCRRNNKSISKNILKAKYAYTYIDIIFKIYTMYTFISTYVYLYIHTYIFTIKH